MDAKLHSILGQLHSLLAMAQPEDLDRAGRLPSISPFMREALRSLAKERASRSREDRQVKEVSPESKRGDVTTQSLFPSVRARRVGRDIEQILQLVLGSPRLSTKAVLGSFARAMGLEIKLQKKESWRRTARKLAKAIAMAPQDVRLRSIDAILASRDTQTQGWVEVIRRSR